MRKIGKKSYKAKLDKLFSEFIRLRDNGKGCYTCGVKRTWKQLQCGHFIPRQYLALRYDEVNCHSQCYACNMLYNGQPSVFALNLIRDYGEGIIAELEKKRQALTKDFPYEKKIEEYREKVALLMGEIIL